MNLSVKVSALTPLLRPDAPDLGRLDAAERLRRCCARARELGAHLHIDMESMDSREAVTDLVLGLLSEDEFSAGPSAGVVVQAYLRDSPELLDRIVAWSAECGRSSPLTVRLVKGAYWDHEIVEARQHGWTPPVFEVKADSDRNFELLTRRLLEARPALRVAIASHNLRSVAHAIAASHALGGGPADLELQVLRGLGDDLQRRARRRGPRVRTYCPVGDLVAGMAYLVRRLLENTSNKAFLAGQAARRPARGAAGRAMSFAPFDNEPLLELRRAPSATRCCRRCPSSTRELPLSAPLLDRRRAPRRRGARVDRPRRAGARRGARAARDARRGRARAVDAAARGFAAWSRTPAAQRAEALAAAPRAAS